MGLKANCSYLYNSGGLEPNGVQQGGGVVGQLAKGPGHVGQILLAELLNTPFSFTGKPVHHPLTVKACMHTERSL